MFPCSRFIFSCVPLFPKSIFFDFGVPCSLRGPSYVDARPEKSVNLDLRFYKELKYVTSLDWLVPFNFMPDFRGTKAGGRMIVLHSILVRNQQYTQCIFCASTIQINSPDLLSLVPLLI